MRTSAKARLCALALLVTLCGPLPTVAQVAEPVGSVAALIGSAFVARSGGAEVRPLIVQAELFQGDRVMTAVGSRVELLLVDGSILRLGEGTDLELSRVLHTPEEETRNVLIAVGLGIVRTVVHAVVPRSWFELRTATAITSVRGTDWILEAAADATPVVALEGEVAVRNVFDRIEEEVVLGPGEGTTVRAGEPPGEVSEWGQARVDSFIARTSVGPP